MDASQDVSFADHVELLNHFLDRRREIVERIDRALLNVQGKDTSRRRDRPFFEHTLSACFFGLPGLSRDRSRMKGQLAAGHLADGFEPIQVGQFTNELDPVELVGRAYYHWNLTRWPGSSGRQTYAQTIFAVFVLRELERLSLRIWDSGGEPAPARLATVQDLLDTLNAEPTPAAFVRDARWLIQTSQGPLTRHLRPYFHIAEHVDATLPDQDRLAVHHAGAVLAGGHLRSQLRYAVWRTHQPIDAVEVLSYTRNSNTMDNALLLRDLVCLLEAYQAARAGGDSDRRLMLADATLQGLSADPELFLTRLDLLTPCTMAEDLFIERGGDDAVRWTAMGAAHRALLDRYGRLLAESAAQLREEAAAFAPVPGSYSPYGIVYGFCADVMSNMATGTLLAQPSFDLSLEDMFVSRADTANKLARSRLWEKLPTREGEREHFEHTDAWAESMFMRLTTALDARIAHPGRPNASDQSDARVFIVADTIAAPPGAVPAGAVPVPEYCVTSDITRASSGAARLAPQSQILDDRSEGRFLASVESDGTWVGISKAVLTAFTSHGQDVLVTGVPSPAIDVLRLTCPDLVVPATGA